MMCRNTCPYYEVKTSYGTELIKCGNEECVFYPKEKRNERYKVLRHSDKHRRVL